MLLIWLMDSLTNLTASRSKKKKITRRNKTAKRARLLMGKKLLERQDVSRKD